MTIHVYRYCCCCCCCCCFDFSSSTTFSLILSNIAPPPLHPTLSALSSRPSRARRSITREMAYLRKKQIKLKFYFFKYLLGKIYCSLFPIPSECEVPLRQSHHWTEVVASVPHIGQEGELHPFCRTLLNSCKKSVTYFVQTHGKETYSNILENLFMQKRNGIILPKVVHSLGGAFSEGEGIIKLLLFTLMYSCSTLPLHRFGPLSLHLLLEW